MTDQTIQQPAEHLAWRALTYTADRAVWETCEAWLDVGGRWVYDPDVTGVVGLLKPGSVQQAVCVVYLAGSVPDFELSDDFESVNEAALVGLRDPRGTWDA